MIQDSTKLNVVHVVSSLNVGGAERFVVDLCSTQQKMNIAPSIISLGIPDEPLEQVCKQLAIPFYSYSNHKLIKLFHILMRLRKFDIIHIHSQHALKYLNVALPWLAQKIIYTRHGAAALTSSNWQAVHKKAMKHINSVTFVSQEGRDIFMEHHKWHKIPNYVIDNGVIIDPVQKTPSTKLRIGSVGRMVPLKHQISLLKAVNLLATPQQAKIALHFFGDGECLNALQSYQRDSLATVEIHFHGMVNERNAIYANIDLLVVTSETEGLSMVIIEAMANHIPVIATNVGGNPKLVIDNKTGWLFEYDDESCLANFIQTAIDNPIMVANMGNEAFSYISEHFSMQTAAAKYAEIYAS
jgi:glycosyltransferase involved in cell wall biosynthesis